MTITTYPSPTLYQDLRNLGYVGAFNDMFNKWLDDNGYGPGTLTDKIALFKGVGVPTPPYGYYLLRAADGRYLRGADGAYLYGRMV